jgi:hypothetical protein
LENLNRIDHFEGLGVDRMMMLNWIRNKHGVRVWRGLTWLRIRTSERYCEYGSEPSGCIKCD